MTTKLPDSFDSREDLIAHVAALTPWLQEQSASSITGGRVAAGQRLQEIDPVKYCRTRNFLNGKVTQLSPYIRHGILTLDRVRNLALEKCSSAEQIEKFIQELS